MATSLQNLSGGFNPDSVPDASKFRFAIVVSEWNSEITERLKEGAVETLLRCGAKRDNIIVSYVPGSFELIFGAKDVVKQTNPNAVIVIGSVIRGETPHFDYVCQGVTQGIAHLNIIGSIPYIFGLLTTNNMEEALDRAGGKYGNKGCEYAVTAIKMVNLAY
jgi:6,7-dimethyl-8-ribityllumazine synthase